METETQIQRATLYQVAKKISTRIKVLKAQLLSLKNEEGRIFDDSFHFYMEKETEINAQINELIQLKISIEKWRKKLTYTK